MVVTDPSIYAEIAKAIPVVIGGLLAASAGVATQFLTHHLAIKREERNAKRERLEALVKAVYASEQWVTDCFNSMIFRDEDHRTPSPLAEARMISALYFPELTAELLKVHETQITLFKFVIEQSLARRKDLQSWSKNWDPQPYYDSFKEYSRSVIVLTLKCQKLLA